MPRAELAAEGVAPVIRCVRLMVVLVCDIIYAYIYIYVYRNTQNGERDTGPRRHGPPSYRVPLFRAIISFGTFSRTTRAAITRTHVYSIYMCVCVYRWQQPRLEEILYTLPPIAERSLFSILLLLPLFVSFLPQLARSSFPYIVVVYLVLCVYIY